MHEVFNVAELCKRDAFKEHTPEEFDMILEAADSLSTTHLRPILLEMDRNPPHIVNGRVKVHPKMREIMKRFGEDGWISMSAPYEHGGQQVPFTILQMAGFIMAAANYSPMAYAFLTNGAAHLIETFGSKELFDTYVTKMFNGEWQGTMALSEPQAGSSLSDVVTSATPTDKGYYLIKGQKVFISCGDHDGVDNIVHLMLARIDGAPVGTKGISLFVVPRERYNDKGELEFNDVNTAGVFHKMGYHGAPIAHLMMGEAGGPVHPGQSATLRLGPKVVLARFGMVHPATLKAFDVDGPIAAVELFLDAIPAKKGAAFARPGFTPPALQAVTRDFAFLVPASLAAGDLVRAVQGADKAFITAVRVFDVFAGQGVPEGHKSVAVEVTLQPGEASFKDAELKAIAEKVVAAAAKLGGELR